MATVANNGDGGETSYPMDEVENDNIHQPPSLGQRYESSTSSMTPTRRTSPTKSRSLLGMVTPQRLSKLGRSGGSGGGGGFGSLPAKKRVDGIVHSGDSLDTYILPINLRMDAATMDDVDQAVTQTQGGMEVIKVSKNGKQQTRRLCVAPNNRAIYITTNKHPQGRVLGLLKQGGADEAFAIEGPMKEVDLSRVVRVQFGQQSRRFVKARTKQDTTSDTPQSLSIIYRRSASSSAKDKLVKSMKKGKLSQAVMDAGEDSLDLIIPDKSDFASLSKTLEDLLAFYQEEEPNANPDYAFIQYHLVDMGKSLGEGCLVSCSDWVTLCKRWNAPISKADATALYRNFCDSLAISSTQTDGLEMYEVVRLLEILRQRGLDALPGKGGGGDPRKGLFHKIAQSKCGYSLAISAKEFLNFLHESQKETDMTLNDVKDLFYRLNGHRISPQLEDAISTRQESTTPTPNEGDTVSWEKEYITWDAFGRYLMLESNDIFDPERASFSEGCMNEPLNNYWINSSHDTYLRRTKASGTNEQKTDLQSYTLALYRGARAIELDVWDDGGKREPVVRLGSTSFEVKSSTNKSSTSNSLNFSDVILTISYFLQSEPDSLPVILLIENHCSLPYQQKIAKHIEKILGKQNLLYRPDLKENDSMPSPAQLKGKVVIKSKIPEKIMGQLVALNDDFDDENREAASPSFLDYDSEDDIKEYVVGFNSTSSIKSPTPTTLTVNALYQTARSESLEAASAENAANNLLIDVKHQAQQSQNHADAMLRDINMTYDELKQKREEGFGNLPEEGTEVELGTDGVSKIKETADHAMEIAQAFAESVEESRLLAIAATTEARSETELFEIAREDLTDKEANLSEANMELQEVTKNNRDLIDAAERSLAEARINREYGENAERRVTAVRGLLDRSHNQAITSETVAATADAEASISEQRAKEAEIRAEKARVNEESERKKAAKETKWEDDLHIQLVEAQKKLNEVNNAVDAARERADDAVDKADKLTDEIREAKTMAHDDEISVAESTVIVDKKRATRKGVIGEMEKALTDKLGFESSTRKLENTIDDLKRKVKLQAKTAAAARRQADHSMAIADQLEEHALEEREAANLRQAARVKAKQGVSSSDAVLTSTEAQLTEAEKAAAEANEIALACRQKAEEMAREAEAVQDVAPLEAFVRIAQEDRDAALGAYETANMHKEIAVERAAKAKQLHETNCVNLANLERDAMAELLHKEAVQQAELMAITACENARALNDQMGALEKAYQEAKALAVEKLGALVIATRYKDKKKRLQPVSPSLAKLTLLHSANHRNWEKSSQLPSYAMHSIPDTRVVTKAEQGKEEWERWVEFNKAHFARVYPESASRNYNPVLPWAMGYQFVSMNFIRNKFMLLNDGRFRENGNQGYVLKPEYLCNSTSSFEPGSAGDALNCTTPRKISIRILSGMCLPKSVDKKSSSTINPFVRVTLYDASPATLLPSPVFKTQVVDSNGLNPVWNSKEAANFSCLNPSVGMLLFSVYDHCNIHKTDLFIGSSAMPVSCIREGFRCVSLFDSNNARSGSMKHACLFIKVKIE